MQAATHTAQMQPAPARAEPMTPARLAREYKAHRPAGHFFDRASLRFFGDTMANYGVNAQPVSVYCADGTTVLAWCLYRRRPVKHGMQGSAYFAVSDYRQLFPQSH